MMIISIHYILFLKKGRLRKFNMNRNIKILILLLVSTMSFSQSLIGFKSLRDTSVIGFSVPVEVSISDMSLGDAIIIELEYIDPTKLMVDTSKNIYEKIDFELTDFGMWKGRDNTLFYDGKNNKNTINIRIWDLGDYIIRASSNINEKLKVKTDTITIISGLNPVDSLKQLAPINDIIREKAYK